MTLKITEFLVNCPFFDGAVPCADFLGAEYGSVSVKQKSQNRVRSKYIDGGILVTDTYLLSIRDSFTPIDSENERILEKCRAVEGWIYSQSLKGTLPQSENASVVSLEVSRGFAPVWNDGAGARYEAELQLVYLI